MTAPEPSDPRQPAYDAVLPIIHALPQAPLGQVERNAAIWRAVHAALDAMGVTARQPAVSLALASEFRIPCPPSPVSPRRPDDLIVRRRADGQGDGWLILNPNQQPGDHVWTGSEWVYRGELHREVIYKWELGEALEVAPELAAEETRRFEAWVQQMRAERGTR